MKTRLNQSRLADWARRLVVATFRLRSEELACVHAQAEAGDYARRCGAMGRMVSFGCMLLACSAFAQDPDAYIKPWTPLILHPVKDAATLELLRGALKETDPVVRERAQQALALIGDPVAAKRVVPARPAALPLPEALRGSNVLALVHAVQALDAASARREAVALIDLLRRPEVVVREAAVGALGRGQIAAAGPVLLKQLDDLDEGLRLAATQALLMLMKEVSRPELITAMGRRMELDRSSKVRDAAGLVLMGVHLQGETPALDALLKLLQHSRGETRASAAGTVGLLLLKPELAPALHPLLSDREDLGARAAAGSLAILRNPASEGPLLSAFAARGPVVQERAAAALGELRSTNAVPALVALLPRTTDEALKVSLVTALGKIGDKRALPPLRQVLLQIVLTNNLPKAREAAFNALTGFNDKLALPRAIEIVTKPVVPPLPGAGPTYDEDPVRIAALRFLAAVGDRATGAVVLAGLKDPVPREMRPAVAETLGKLLGQNFRPVPDEDYRRYFLESAATRFIPPVQPPGVVRSP